MLPMESKIKIKSEYTHPPEAVKLAQELGGRIRVARLRRKIRQQDMAERTGLSRSTIQSLERGEVTCSIGAFLNVLWTLGLSRELNLIADPGLDRDGLVISLDAEKKRVVIPRKVNNEF